MNYFRLLLLIVLLFSVISPLHASAEDYDLYIAQGIQKINEGKMKDALEFLKKALELSPENPEATYYAGIAYSRVGSYKEAEGLFLKTFRLDETAIDVYLELGRLYYLISRCDKAAESLSIFIELSEDKALMGYAARLIEGCTGEAEEKPYKLDITLGGQYDSNVIIEPENSTLPQPSLT
ncbi:MAG: tetratricopeptide repeat protein, partial [Candidatus Mariimomonas ferrooxydans]